MYRVESKLNEANIKLIKDYIEKIRVAMDEYDSSFQDCEEIFDLLAEIANVFETDIPQIKKSILFRMGTESSDANTTIALLKKCLADSGIEYKEKTAEEDVNVKRFWAAFIAWFESELPNLGLLQDKYLRWDNWDGGMWFLDISYDHEFRLYRGVEYPESLKSNEGIFEDIKTFLEIAYKYWVISEGKSRYEFTVEINERFSIFKLPYRLQNGIVLRQGYKTTHGIDTIINYRMFERKIRFSEDMINSSDLMEKKSALDFIIDALQYLVSTQAGNRDKQYASLALSVNADNNGKVYSVVKQEVNELMKLSNEYFDIRHNDYLNGAKEKREALNDSQFIEYLYNRAYALLFLLRLRNKECRTENTSNYKKICANII